MIKGIDRNIPLCELHPFKDHPYKVEDNVEMDALCESIAKSGLLSPIVVRPRDEGGYEIISGHRRFRAYQRLGITEIPSTVCNMTDEEAIVAMVDANLHRDHILPSEKAFAYKMKLDAIKRQGERTDLTSAQFGQRLTSVEKIAAESDESKSQVQRYISLTRLIPELLQMVDEGKIAFTPAVELSYLPHELQDKIVEIFERDEATPSYAQTVRFRRLLGEGKLTADAIEDIMAKPKANQKETVKFSYERIARFFPPEYSTKQMEDAIVRMLEERKREVGAMPAPRRRNDAERG